MSELYLGSGTYLKSFFTVMYMPSCTKIGMMISNHQRIHHIIDWERAVPKIISDKFKKE